MKKVFSIAGMHCVSCEILLEEVCNACKGCTVKRVNHKQGIVEVDLGKESSEEEIKKAIASCGYDVVEDKKNDKSNGIKNEKKSVDDWIQTIAIFIGVAAVARMLSKININQYIPSFGSDVSVGIALVMGLIASISTCLAVTGGIVVGFSQYVDDSSGRGGRVKAQAGFHVGRIVGFVVLGALLGRIGQFLTITLGAQGFITVLVGFVFLYIGLYMLGIVPNITKLGFHLPASRTKSVRTQRNPLLAPLVGALTFLLPCGFTQSMQLLALSSGDPAQGALIMGAFALGTFPVLFAVGLGSSYVKQRNRMYGNILLGSLLFLFGVFSMYNGATLLGRNGSLFSGAPSVGNTQNTQQPTAPAGIYEEIVVGHDGLELVPTTVALTAGKNYTLTIVPEKNGIGCMSTLTIPTLDKKVHPIVAGQPISYSLTNVQPGTYPVVCGSMGMRQGQITVN